MWLQFALKQFDEIERSELWLEGHTKKDSTIPHELVRAAHDPAVSHVIDHIYPIFDYIRCCIYSQHELIISNVTGSADVRDVWSYHDRS